MADILTLRRSARSRHRPTSSAFSTSIIRCTMPLGVGMGRKASEWWRGLQPKKRSQAGSPSAGLPTICGGIRMESRSRKPSTSR
ncbi:Uncharacterised protein [Mycobacteroides abscessus subsp. abscessus]|nr:Uncharacterised protein [Mycobacteroides abscessus subsp. abscessus]